MTVLKVDMLITARVSNYGRKLFLEMLSFKNTTFLETQLGSWIFPEGFFLKKSIENIIIVHLSVCVNLILVTNNDLCKYLN